MVVKYFTRMEMIQDSPTPKAPILSMFIHLGPTKLYWLGRSIRQSTAEHSTIRNYGQAWTTPPSTCTTTKAGFLTLQILRPISCTSSHLVVQVVLNGPKMIKVTLQVQISRICSRVGGSASACGPDTCYAVGGWRNSRTDNALSDHAIPAAGIVTYNLTSRQW